MTTVLVSSAGRRVELLRGFRQALDDLGLDGRVVATDQSWYSSARHSADAGYDVPACSDPAFVPRLVELCAEERVDLVVPTIDPELPVLAAASAELAAVGTTVAVSAPAVVAIAADKVATHDWLVAHDFPTVRQATVATVRDDPASWPFPLMVKPRFGSAAHGVAVVNDTAELDVAARVGEVVVQTVAAGREHTIDVLVDRTGACVCAVPRRRIEVRAGEVSKAITVRSPTLEQLAADVCAALPGPFGALDDPGLRRRHVRPAGDHRAQCPLRRRLPALARGRCRLPALDPRGPASVAPRRPPPTDGATES